MQQPTKNRLPRQRGVWRRGATSARRRGSTMQFFGGALLVDRRLKIKNKLLSLENNFFLGPFILFSKTPRHRRRPTPSAEASGGGAAQNIKALLLDQQPAPPWCCSLLDGHCLEYKFNPSPLKQYFLVLLTYVEMYHISTML